MKNRIKQIVIWGMVVACIICSVNIQTTTVDASTTKKVSISKSSLKLKTKVKYKLKVNGTTKKVVWKSSNKKVAKVSQSWLVKDIKPGKTVVSAKVGKKTYKCTVRVYTGTFKHKHKYKEIIKVDATFLILDPAIVTSDEFDTAGANFGYKEGDCLGEVLTVQDIPDFYFSYDNGGGTIYKGIYCRGKLIDKTHFRRDTLKNDGFDNVGNVSLVTGNNSRIIDLTKLEWYCIHNETTSYNECVYCGETGHVNYGHDAHKEVSIDNESEKKYYNPNCTCRKFAAKQYGRCFLLPVKSVREEPPYVITSYGKLKIKFSRCKHKNGLDYYYSTDIEEEKRYKCRDCGAVLSESDLK